MTIRLTVLSRDSVFKGLGWFCARMRVCTALVGCFLGNGGKLTNLVLSD